MTLDTATSPSPGLLLPTPKLLVFAGSARAGSYNRKLAKVAVGMAQALGAEVTLLDLGALDIPLYNADLEAQGTPPDVINFKQALYAHPAWIVCAPEYNGSMTGLLKNAIDWASSPVKGHAQWASGGRPFVGKVAGLLGASPGALGGLRGLMQLQPLLMNLQCWVAPRQYALAQAHSAFGADGELLDQQHRAGVQAVVEQVLFAASRLALPVA